MKPLNQYPKHKRKKIEKIRLINELRKHFFTKVANTNIHGFTYDMIEAAVRQIRNPHNFPIYPNDNTVEHIKFVKINRTK